MIELIVMPYSFGVNEMERKTKKKKQNIQDSISMLVKSLAAKVRFTSSCFHSISLVSLFTNGPLAVAYALSPLPLSPPPLFCHLYIHLVIPS